MFKITKLFFVLAVLSISACGIDVTDDQVIERDKTIKTNLINLASLKDGACMGLIRSDCDKPQTQAIKNKAAMFDGDEQTKYVYGKGMDVLPYDSGNECAVKQPSDILSSLLLASNGKRLPLVKKIVIKGDIVQNYYSENYPSNPLGDRHNYEKTTPHRCNFSTFVMLREDFKKVTHTLNKYPIYSSQYQKYQPCEELKVVPFERLECTFKEPVEAKRLEVSFNHISDAPLRTLGVNEIEVWGVY